MKNFEIVVKCFTTVVVTAEDSESALQYAADEISLRGMDLDEMSVESELKSRHEIERAIKVSEYHRYDFHPEPYQA